MDNTTLNVGTGGDLIRTDDIAGVKFPVSKIALGADGVDGGLVGAGTPLPVSAASLPLPAGAATEATLAARVPVNGQALMAASVPVTFASNQSALGVTGTFWQATQPVSGTVTANIGTSGSLALDATLTGGTAKAILRTAAKGTTVAGDATSTPVDANTQALDVSVKGSAAVTGTFWQATQPVSAVSLPLPAGAATEATLAARIPVNGQALMAASVPVTFASNQSALGVTGTFWQATQPVSGTITSAQGTAAAATAPWATRLTDGAAFIDPRDVSDRAARLVGVVTVAAGTASIGTTLGPTITKGTQGTTGYTTQPLRDAGRTLVAFTAASVVGVAAEALISLTPYRDLVAGAAATTHAVTAGKRLRLQRLVVTARAIGTVNVGGIIRLRMLAGTVLVGSPVHMSVGTHCSILATAVTGHAQTESIDFPEGFELSGTMQIGLTQLFSATGATIDVHVIGYEY